MNQKNRRKVREREKDQEERLGGKERSSFENRE
jgi:hypothetical protein